jgi:hypothetical protein
MNKQQAPKPIQGLIISELDDGTVILDPGKGNVRVVNDVGYAIWKLLDGHNTIAQISTEICNEYDVTENQADEDIRLFISDLAHRGLVILEDESTSE